MDHECSRCRRDFQLSSLNSTVRRYIAHPWFNHVELHCHRSGCDNVDRRFFTNRDLEYITHALGAPELRSEVAPDEVLLESYRQRGPVTLNSHQLNDQEYAVLRDFREALASGLWPRWLPWDPPAPAAEPPPPPVTPGA